MLVGQEITVWNTQLRNRLQTIDICLRLGLFSHEVESATSISDCKTLVQQSGIVRQHAMIVVDDLLKDPLKDPCLMSCLATNTWP